MFFTWHICKALALTSLPIIDGPSRPLEAGWFASQLGWACLARPVLLSRDSRTCRAQRIPGKTRDCVVTSHRLGIKRTAANVRLACSTRHVFGKARRLSNLLDAESYVCLAVGHGKQLLDLTSLTCPLCLSRAPRPIHVYGLGSCRSSLSRSGLWHPSLALGLVRVSLFAATPVPTSSLAL